MSTHRFILLFTLIMFSSGLPANGQDVTDCLQLAVPGKDCLWAIERYLDTEATPLIDGEMAYFLYRGEAETVHLAGDFNGWQIGPDRLMPFAGADSIFVLAKKFDREARLDYKLVIDSTNWILDPGNPWQRMGGYGANSELRMPEYLPPWETETREGTARGRLLTDTIDSELTGRAYGLHIYLPNGYSEGTEYPAVFFQDGSDYLNFGAASTILDNLIDSALVEPLVAVFVTPAARHAEYVYEDRDIYTTFFVHELIPRMRSRFSLSADPARTAVVGPSFGGHIAAYIAYRHPEIIGLCGMHSPSFWPEEEEIADILAEGDLAGVRWVAVYSSFEESTRQQLARAFASLIHGDGRLIVRTYQDGHSWGLWRRTLDDLLIYLFE